jgi:hypothetical protein
MYRHSVIYLTSSSYVYTAFTENVLLHMKYVEAKSHHLGYLHIRNAMVNRSIASSASVILKHVLRCNSE